MSGGLFANTPSLRTEFKLLQPKSPAKESQKLGYSAGIPVENDLFKGSSARSPGGLHMPLKCEMKSLNVALLHFIHFSLQSNSIGNINRIKTYAADRVGLESLLQPLPQERGLFTCDPSGHADSEAIRLVKPIRRENTIMSHQLHRYFRMPLTLRQPTLADTSLAELMARGSSLPSMTVFFDHSDLLGLCLEGDGRQEKDGMLERGRIGATILIRSLWERAWRHHKSDN
ncbi:hypothetical protein BO82DRAFT_397221 [Aspergillus uvarum CBS 121591]|uniref:Uncharacterized protein n=1 Tax=Aspergillus uvarum CBS 121591 TaxID=1448315 RepID=A0A319CSP2_9EURO|nr:hypothetical protein BO82DRAFT_397221 [Aspergillus uvarum CBS 121591]PYH87311.1 hypothetical protein BO82DRAFT_397221 [Aspergillus uvarum CBS 121591]